MSIWKYDHRIIFVFAITAVCACRRGGSNAVLISTPTVISFAQNPGGNWEIGYSKNQSLDPNEFQRCAFPDTVRPVPIWHPGMGTDNYYPYTGQNRDSVLTADSSNRWALRPGEIGMEGSNTGQYALLRFIVPADGDYHVRAMFEGVHIGGSTTDVHVLYGSRHLFDDFIDGYGGDPSFHAISSTHPSALYEETLVLHKGDTLTFAVGYGSNQTYYNDTTGLLLLIEPL